MFSTTASGLSTATRCACSRGMTYIVIVDGLVVEEIEFFDRAAAARSIGLVPTVSFTEAQ